MRNRCWVLSFLLATAAFSSPAHAVCVPTISPVNSVRVSFLDGESDDTNRREFAQISQSLAIALGIGGVDPDDAEHPNPQIRVRMQGFTNLGNLAIANNNAVFTVVAINDVPDNFHRLWVYRQEDADDEDSGQFKLFARPNETIVPTPDVNADTILDDVLVRVFSVPVSSSEYTDEFGAVTPTTYYCEPSDSRFYLERTIRVDDDHIVVMTPHGGNIETDTSDQSELFAATYYNLTDTEVNVWDLQGEWGEGQTDERWHITSTSILPASYPGLDQLLTDAGSFEYAVSFHGYSGLDGDQVCDDYPAEDDSEVYEVILGGDAEQNLKCAISDAIVAAVPLGTYPGGIAIDIRDDDGNLYLPDACGRTVSTDEHSGTHADNIVNRVSTVAGIQVEQSKTIRDNDALRDLVTNAIAQGIATYNSGDDYCP